MNDQPLTQDLRHDMVASMRSTGPDKICVYTREGLQQVTHGEK